MIWNGSEKMFSTRTEVCKMDESFFGDFHSEETKKTLNWIASEIEVKALLGLVCMISKYQTFENIKKF
jgi:hypothetical protein